MMKMGCAVAMCVVMTLSTICSSKIDADVVVVNTEAVADVLVLQDDQPLTHAQLIFMKSIAGRVDSVQYASTTDATGRVTIHVPDSGYYQARVMDATGAVIGSWHSIPLNTGQQTALILRVGKSYELIEPGNMLIPQAPATLRVSYGANGKDRYITATWPVSVDQEKLRNYRLYREMPDDIGGIVQLTFVPWMEINIVISIGDSVNAVIPVLDTLITPWAVAAERISPNGVVSSALTIAPSPLRPVDTIPPAPATNLQFNLGSTGNTLSLFWTPSVDDVVTDSVSYRGQVFPIAGVRAYEVYRQIDSGDWVFLAQLPRGATGYVDNNLPWTQFPPYTSFSYRVDALDFDNRTSQGITIVMTPKPTHPDMNAFYRAFGAHLGDASYSSDADMNGDGVVNFTDFLLGVESTKSK